MLSGGVVGGSETTTTHVCHTLSLSTPLPLPSLLYSRVAGHVDLGLQLGQRRVGHRRPQEAGRGPRVGGVGLVVRRQRRGQHGRPVLGGQGGGVGGGLCRVCGGGGEVGQWVSVGGESGQARERGGGGWCARPKRRGGAPAVASF